MRLLLFSDLHCNLPATYRILEQAKNVDVAIGAGDFGQMRTRVSVCIDVLRDLPCPAVFVPGNGESFDELNDACRGYDNIHVLHGPGTTIDGVPFFGLGGGVPTTPYGAWSYDLTEVEAAVLLKDCPTGGVLVTHSPPKGCLDKASSGESLGSTAIRDTIRTKKPALVVCGHVHACGGRSESFHTALVVNAGPRGVVIEMDASRLSPENGRSQPF